MISVLHFQASLHFNPQGPHGPRHTTSRQFPASRLFQSTRPSRASTINNCHFFHILPISIHKALTGLDKPHFLHRKGLRYFNPQGPHGPRLWCRYRSFYQWHFNPQGPHGPRRPSSAEWKAPGNFNPQGPHGPRLSLHKIFPNPFTFQSTRPSRASTY